MPEADRSRANDDLTYSVCSAMGYARNLSVVASGDVVIAVGGAWGTLSEIALARNLGRTVVCSTAGRCGRPARPARGQAGRPPAGGDARRGRGIALSAAD